MVSLCLCKDKQDVVWLATLRCGLLLQCWLGALNFLTVPKVCCQFERLCLGWLLGWLQFLRPPITTCSAVVLKWIVPESTQALASGLFDSTARRQGSTNMLNWGCLVHRGALSLKACKSIRVNGLQIVDLDSTLSLGQTDD